MKLAFLIAAHTHPDLLARLVKRLQDSHASIHLHLDLRSDAGAFQRAFDLEKIEGVHWVKRIKCCWSTFDQVQVSLILLAEALRNDPDAEMFILISGQDYPLKTPGEMADFFQERPGTDFLEYLPFPYPGWSDKGGFERFTHYYFAWHRRIFKFPDLSQERGRLNFLLNLCLWPFLSKPQPLPAGLDFYGGASWWNLTRKTVTTILDYFEKNPAYVRMFHHSLFADEMIFQTLLMNLGGFSLESNCLRCAFWDGRRNQYPAVVQADDFDEIKAANAFFVRKVDPDDSREVMDRIDRELLGRGQAAPR